MFLTATVFYVMEIMVCGNVSCFILKQCHKEETLLLKKQCVSVA